MTLSPSRPVIDKALKAFVKEFAGKSDLEVSMSEVTYHYLLSNRMLLVHSIREGIPFHLFELMKKAMPFTSEEWAVFLSISLKSLQRYQASGQRFKPAHSEKIFELAEVTEAGLQVFDDLNAFQHWLRTPTLALNGMKPFDLLRDSYGKDLVLAELQRIDHGIFA